jgi:hypothetical protein
MTAVLESIEQTCQRYSVGRTQLHKLVKAGKIEAVKDGSRTKIVVASADKHFASLPKVKPAAAAEQEGAA